MRKFKDISQFVSHYEKQTTERGGRNDWRVGLAQSSTCIPHTDTRLLFFEDYYVRVVMSLDSQAMVIERKFNHNPVFCRTGEGVIRTHGEWTLCQYPELVTSDGSGDNLRAMGKRLEEAKGAANDAARALTTILYLYSEHRVGSQGPQGCIMGALKAIAPDVAREIEETGADATYRSRWSPPRSEKGKKKGKKLKVYGWTGWHKGKQTREICAAPSKAAVGRIYKGQDSFRSLDVSETGNLIEIEAALANPGVVLYAPLNHRATLEDWQPKVGSGIAITQPISNCDGSGMFAYDPSNEDGRGKKLRKPCPGCRACQ